MEGFRGTSDKPCFSVSGMLLLVPPEPSKPYALNPLGTRGWHAAARFTKPPGFKRLANVLDPSGYVFRNKEDSWDAKGLQGLGFRVQCST